MTGPTKLEKIVFPAAIVGSILLIVLFGGVLDFFDDDVKTNRMETGAISTGPFLIRLECESDSDFIVENSKIKCYTILNRTNQDWRWVYITIQAFDRLNETDALFGCQSSYDYRNSSQQDRVLCENSFYRDVFRPEVSGTYSLAIIRTEAYDNLGQPAFENYEKYFFRNHLNVITISEARSIELSDKSFKVAFLALALFIPTLFFEFRRFYMGN